MDQNTWNSHISSLPNPPLLQTYQWGIVKSQFGWRPHHEVWRDADGEVVAAALILERALSLPGLSLRMLYAPKGPLLADWGDTDLLARVLTDLRAFAMRRGAFFLKIDPDVNLGFGIPGETDARDDTTGTSVLEALRAAGWRFSNEQVQFRSTLTIDLSPSEGELLANMKQKTRYNLRLAARKGVAVRLGGPADFTSLYQLYAETARRDAFFIRPQDYYLAVWETFYQDGMLHPLIAEVQGDMVAGLMLFTFGGAAWYIYGMSRALHREKMPNYLLQWEAIRTAKAAGCTTYDLWGAPDTFDESDPLWGVYRFKRGLGGFTVRRIGAWDLPLRPSLYALYTGFLPRLLSLMRFRARAAPRPNAGV